MLDIYMEAVRRSRSHAVINNYAVSLADSIMYAANNTKDRFVLMPPDAHLLSCCTVRRASVVAL